MKKSLKYRFLLKVVRLLPAKRIMAAPKEKAQKLFRKAYKGENNPELTDPDLNISQDKINGATVLVYQHKKASDRIGIYLVGEGMYHSYAMTPFVNDAQEGYRHFKDYISA